MAVTNTTRFVLPQWSAGSDPPVTRAQLNTALSNVETKAAGYLEDTAANRPAAAAANKGFIFRATDTGALSISTGSTWLPISSGTFLATAGGQMTGALDMNGQEIQNAIVINAKAKRSTLTQLSNGSLTLDANNAMSFTVTLQANVTGITVNNLDDGESIKVTFVEDATGGRTVAFPGGWIWPSGGTATTPFFKTTANAKNVVYLEKEGSDIQAYLAADLKT